VLDTGYVNTNDFVNADKYMCIQNSIFVFFRSCECQRYQVNHRHESCSFEVNTTAVIEDGNVDKTHFISRPLQEICTFIGRLGSITSGSQFVW